MLKSAFLSGEAVLNFCANNYPEPANHPKVIKAAQDAMNY
jgi:7-keto-8-aminopelargonate synthetase-like enzyme